MQRKRQIVYYKHLFYLIILKNLNYGAAFDITNINMIKLSHQIVTYLFSNIFLYTFTHEKNALYVLEYK